MTDTQVLDKAYHFLVNHIVETGQAHYSDLATGLGCSTEYGRQLVHDLAEAVPSGIRLNPGTDWIATLTPFSLIPTPFRITVDGQQKWFGIGGPDALAVSWLFPGKTVSIDSPCLDCNEGISIQMRDGHVIAADPSTIVGHRNLPIGKTAPTEAGGQMNFFRSEEHMRNWSQFNPDSIEGSLSLDDELTWANVEVAKHRLDGDYISQWANKQREQREEVAQRLGKSGLFWTRGTMLNSCYLRDYLGFRL